MAEENCESFKEKMRRRRNKTSEKRKGKRLWTGGVLK